jgi:hypothetical protein
VAANLLLPLVRLADWEAASEADLVVTFWGTPVRRTGALRIDRLAEAGSLVRDPAA